MSQVLPVRLDQQRFGEVVVSFVWLLIAPLFLATMALSGLIGSLPEWAQTGATFLGVPLVSVGPVAAGILSMGAVSFGVVSVGALSFGVISIGGGLGVISFGGVGVISFGGVSLGVVALGGASCGVIAIGGAALGYVAIGGGARGVYVLAGSGKGRYVMDRQRQDPEAVEFFCKYVPRLRKALILVGPSGAP